MIARNLLIVSALVVAVAAIAQQTRKYDFALVSGDSVHSWGSWNSNEVKALDAGTKGDRLIFKKDGKLFVITDKASIARAKKIMEPINALGRQQGELGRQQGELGRKQGELGRQQGEIGKEQGLLAGERARRITEKDRTGAEKEFSAKMLALGKKQTALGVKQQELGRQQRGLGEKQRDLGQRQRAAVQKAGAEMDDLIDGAIAKGLAKPTS